MNRTYTWTIEGGRVLGPAPFFIAGIVNVTPDSFYDGGKNYDHQNAIANGRMLAAKGADILDVGGGGRGGGGGEARDLFRNRFPLKRS